MNKHQRKIFALHIYSPQALAKVIKKTQLLQNWSDQIWISSCNSELLSTAKAMLHETTKSLRLFHCSNKWHDWSGYIEMLQETTAEDIVIICNDSLITSRRVSKKNIQLFLEKSHSKSKGLVGELDTMAQSVDLLGWSSTGWVSSYLFRINGLTLDLPSLEQMVELQAQEVVKNSSHVFIQYLHQRRTSKVANETVLKAKLGGMFFERWLTRLAIEAGIPITNCFAGKSRRKLERKLERFSDA